MKKFELIVYNRIIPNVIGTTKIEADSLIELCAKFPLMIIQIQDRYRINKEELMKQIDEDIPF